MSGAVLPAPGAGAAGGLSPAVAVDAAAAGGFFRGLWLTERASLAGDDWLLHGRFDRDGLLLAVEATPILVDLDAVLGWDKAEQLRFVEDYLSACDAMAARNAETARYVWRCRREAQA